MPRKIIHCDADCFFAAIEMRDNPHLRGRPVAVGGRADRRGVISTCNYEARRFGVHSAMASAQALKLCPELLIVPHRMEQYQQASRQMREIFHCYTDLVEPLSLDEAYLDVTDAKACQGSATRIAEEIRQRVARQVGITVSAGVANSKFLAKIASDWNKPDGLWVIEPDQVDDFVLQLPVRKIHGVGKVTANRLHQLGVQTCADLRRFGLNQLCRQFGVFGPRLHELAHGIDNREVRVSRIRKSLSVEHTYPQDLPSLNACLEQVPLLLEELSARLAHLGSDFTVGKAFVKIKFRDFSNTTLERAGTRPQQQDYVELMTEALGRKSQPVRLLGLGVRFELSQLHDPRHQFDLFSVAEDGISEK